MPWSLLIQVFSKWEKVLVQIESSIDLLKDLNMFYWLLRIPKIFLLYRSSLFLCLLSEMCFSVTTLPNNFDITRWLFSFDMEFEWPIHFTGQSLPSFVILMHSNSNYLRVFSIGFAPANLISCLKRIILRCYNVTITVGRVCITLYIGERPKHSRPFDC